VFFLQFLQMRPKRHPSPPLIDDRRVTTAP